MREAVGLAVREAVQAVLAELLTNPALREQLQKAASPDPPDGSANKDGGDKGQLATLGSRVCDKQSIPQWTAPGGSKEQSITRQSLQPSSLKGQLAITTSASRLCTEQCTFCGYVLADSGWGSLSLGSNMDHLGPGAWSADILLLSRISRQGLRTRFGVS